MSSCAQYKFFLDIRSLKAGCTIKAIEPSKNSTSQAPFQINCLSGGCFCFLLNKTSWLLKCAVKVKSYSRVFI